MHIHQEIREFLTTRRARLTPERAGLPNYGRTRRVAGLRREEVALLAGISVEYYTRLERGNARGGAAAVLGAVSARGGADGVVGAGGAAPRLGEAEREHLVDLVRTLNDTRPPRKAVSP